MQYLEIIKQEIEKILKERFGIEGVNFQVGFPEDLKHGDVTTNVCLVASKLVRKSPKEVGEVLMQGLTLALSTGEGIVQKVEQVGPGFINIWLKQEIVQKNVDTQVGSDDTQFVSKKYAGKRVLVEHTSVNLFKPFTLGHLMTNFTGEFIFRAVSGVGAKAISMSYPSDKSIGIAKAIYIIKKEGGLEQEIFKKDLGEVVKYLGDCYVRGVNEYKKFEEEKNELGIREVKDIANNIFNNVIGSDLEVFEFSKNKNIEYFKKMVTSMGSEFKEFIYESEAGEEGKRIVLENTQSDNLLSKLFGDKKIFKRSEGAIVYIPDESRKDISTSVFINSEGNPTYLAKDIGLLSLKFKKYNPDLSIYVVDNEQTSHFKSVFDAGGKINKEWEEKSVHVSHGRMTFKGKKMSSRLGGVPSGEEVISAVLEEVKEKSAASVHKIEPSQEASDQQGSTLQTQKEIALSALRVAILRSKPGVNIDFDPDRSLSFEGDSGPYLCYTHARCCSLLQKVKSPHPNPPPLGEGSPTSSVFASSKIGGDLIRKLFQFEKIVVDSAEEIAPQKLIKYLFEVAGEFNNFYAHNKVITDDEEETAQKMQFVYYTKKVLEKGLYLIGVKAPERM
jgi:arginyl-tRNA synthetase